METRDSWIDDPAMNALWYDVAEDFSNLETFNRGNMLRLIREPQNCVSSKAPQEDQPNTVTLEDNSILPMAAFNNHLPLIKDPYMSTPQTSLAIYGNDLLGQGDEVMNYLGRGGRNTSDAAVVIRRGMNPHSD